MPVLHLDDPDDPRLDDYRTLRNRERTDALYAEGPTVVGRLLTSGLAVRSVVLSTAAWERLGATLTTSVAPDVPVLVVDRSVLHAVVGFDLHRGVIALADRPAPVSLHGLLGTAGRLVLLEGINDHENLGAIARSARGLGADGLVLDPTCADPWYRRSVRVSMGELLHLPVSRSDDWPATLERIAEAGFTIWALTPSPTAASVHDVRIPDRLAVVAGAEGPGLSASTLAAWTNVRIPMHGGVDSLNVGHAVAATLAVVASRKVGRPVTPTSS